MAPFNSKSTSKSICSQFATYRNAIARVALVTSFLVISFLATLPGVSRAQCPDSTYPYPGPAWNGSTSIEEIVAGTTCVVTVTFCYRTESDGTVHYYISAITPFADSACNALPFQQLILGGIAGFENDYGSKGLVIPNCPSSIPVKYTVQDCWQELPPLEPDPVVILEACPDGSSYCLTTCMLCKDPTTHILNTSCSSISVFGGACNALPGSGFSWAFNTCYDINPCGD
jgi:hypothetical protein